MKRNTPCDVENADDFWNYYNSSWILVNDEPHKVSRLAGQGAFELIGLDTGRKVLTLNELKKIAVFGKPLLGNVAWGSSYVYLYTKGIRTAHKGLMYDDSLSYTAFNDYYTSTRLGEPEFNIQDFRAVREVFSPTYSTYSGAFHSLQIGESLGIPVSRTIGLFTVPNSSFPLVSYKAQQVGWAPDHNTVVLQDQYKDYDLHFSKIGVKSVKL